MRRPPLYPLFTFMIAAIFGAATARAEDTLPYSTRTKAYNGYSSIVQGDNETIGMADATVAIPGSISSLETNPAGLTMTMGSVSAQINSSEMRDRSITGAETKGIKSNQWGLAVVPGNWGFALTYYTPSYEGGSYISPNSGRSDNYEVSLKQLRFSASHSLMNHRLSIGASFEVIHAIRNLSEEHQGATDFSVKLGAIYHVRNHFLVGASFSPAQDVGDSVARSGGSTLPGFAQPVRSPMLATVGTGWIPNRYFSVGFSVTGVGTTTNTALLRDENRVVGEHFTIQPRAGASYILGEYKWVKISTALGSYYENPRIEGVPHRLHGTFAFQVNPLFFNIGFGIDRAERFNNQTFSIGIDIVRAARTLKMIPKDSVPPRNGMCPNPLEIKADGLPDSLCAGEKREFAAPSMGDVGQIIQEIPANIGNTLQGKPTASELREEREKYQNLDPTPEIMKSIRKKKPKKKSTATP